MVDNFLDLIANIEITKCKCGHLDSDHAERYNWYSCNAQGCSCSGFEAAQ